MIMKVLSFLYKNLDKAADWLADMIISNPTVSVEAKALEKPVEVSVMTSLPYVVTAGAISATEAFSTAGFRASAYQTTALFAAAGTEILAAPTTLGAGLLTGGVELAAAGAVIIFSSAVAGKLASRAVGHAYNYLTSESANPEATDTAKKLSI